LGIGDGCTYGLGFSVEREGDALMDLMEDRHRGIREDLYALVVSWIAAYFFIVLCSTL
jgi:hypothetical protein